MRNLHKKGKVEQSSTSHFFPAGKKGIDTRAINIIIVIPLIFISILIFYKYFNSQVSSAENSIIDSDVQNIKLARLFGEFIETHAHEIPDAPKSKLEEWLFNTIKKEFKVYEYHYEAYTYTAQCTKEAEIKCKIGIEESDYTHGSTKETHEFKAYIAGPNYTIIPIELQVNVVI